MTQRKGSRVGKQKQGQAQLQIQLTAQRRTGMEELETWRESPLLPGAAPGSNDLGYNEEADGDALIDDGDDSAPGDPDNGNVLRDEEAEDGVDPRRSLTFADLLGSRPPVVVLRLDCEEGTVTARACVAATPTTQQALRLLEQFVQRCFTTARPHFMEEEWDELFGRVSAPLTRRLMLLLRAAVKSNEKVALSEESKEAFTPHDVGLERFAGKFAALPDGTPFSIRLLLLDQRGRERSDHFFDQLPDVVRLLALRRALRQERETGTAVSDNEFRDTMQRAFEELLGIPVPKPTEDQIRRRLRDNFKRKGLGDLFPNQSARQRDYDRTKSVGPETEERV